jgi:MoaA/NifB/PqqE/SkfB family radical SAM enzyme
MDYLRKLEKECDVFTHLTPSYGLDFGCIAVKRMVSITKYGDILPCPYMHVSLGNFFKEPLKDIIERGLNIKYFGQYYESCYMAEDRNFIDKYIVKKVYGKALPVPYTEVFKKEDFITPNERKLFKE